MLKQKVKNFLDKQLDDFDNVTCTLDEDGEYIYVNFSQVLGYEVDKELTFKLINEVLYYHSSLGWKAVEKGTLNKYFWIDLVRE